MTDPVQCSPVATPTRLTSPATIAPNSVGHAGSDQMAMVTSVAASHARGPMAHPQDSKNSWENARPAAAPSTATTTACDSAARQVIPQSMRARVAHRGCR